ncbi:MAG: C-terminal binding protein, partial [Chloroflexota bacterium]|nr:C-terminal binding protein [Chloroflexota bacterium]
MSKPIVVITDHGYPHVDMERQLVESAGAELRVAQCATPLAVIAAAGDADVLLVQWAPIDAQVIASLERCRLIVRYGIGVDNVDLAAATGRGIPVCNVPDYGTEEVADHAVSMTLALARQLPMIDRLVRAGTWKITPPAPMPSFSEMTFAVAGFGRIARAVIERARALRFRIAAYDPLLPPELA